MLATFIDELIPGVLHNFANPLNGIMGRAKLLQRRFDEFIRKMEEKYPGAGQELGQEKIAGDINTIALETDRFFLIFRGLAGKFSLLSSRETERINISQLIETEMQFSDFYLDFKHDFKKNVQLDFNLPEFVGNPAEYSLCISAMFRSAQVRMKDCLEKEISVCTSHDETCISVEIQDKGLAISEACRLLGGETPGPEGNFLSAIDHADQGLYLALLLLKQNGVSMQVKGETGCNRLVLQIPYR